MKALLIDDEASATDILQLMIEKFVPAIESIQTCNLATDAPAIIKNFKPDVVFLDIRMPHLTGFELLQVLEQRPFDVIFTTAHNEYAVQAIRMSAMDYLLKPVDAEELITAVHRLQLKQERRENKASLMQNFVANMSEKKKAHFKLALSTAEGIYFAATQEIIRCEALNNYTRFYLTNERKCITSKTLKDYEELLEGYGFARIHKSHLINLAHVKKADVNGNIIMTDDANLEISRRKKTEVLDKISKRVKI